MHTNGKRVISLIVLTAAGLLGVAACGSSHNAAATSVPRPPAASTPNVQKGGDITDGLRDACALITAADIKSALGLDVASDGHKSLEVRENTGPVRPCNFGLGGAANDKQFVQVTAALFTDGPAAALHGGQVAFDSASATKMQAVTVLSGIGDYAFLAQNPTLVEITAVTGDKMVTIAVIGIDSSGGVNVDAFSRLAQTAIGRL